MQISVKSDISEVTKYLTRLEKQQVPFATAHALTMTARHIAKKTLPQAMRKQLDRPTPFTQRGGRWERATKRKLMSSVYLAPAQDEYLGWQIEGGTRRRATVPASIRLNKYGNIPGRHQGKVKKLIARDDTFVGRVRGVSGVWQRYNKNRKLRLLVRFEDSVQYRKRFDFYGVSAKEAKRWFPRQFRVSLARALASAR